MTGEGRSARQRIKTLTEESVFAMSKKVNHRSKTKTVAPKDWIPRVAILYAAACLVYSLVVLQLRNGPIVVIDEGLYTNIARSLAWEGRIAFRGQPINYPYILYPILLVPLYRLQAVIGGDIYHWVQVFNALLISSSVFPAYLFASGFCGSPKKGFLAACITAIMPDMLMASYEMTEPLLWPLGLWVVFFSWRMLQQQDRMKWPLLAGLFSGLMYAAKPGAIAMGAGILVCLAILALKEKEKKQLRNALAAAGCALLVIGLMYAADMLLFGYEFSIIGLYNKQTSDWAASHLVAAIEGCFLMAFAFCFACAGFFALAPYFNLKEYDPAQRKMLAAATLGLSLALIGTAFLVVPYKWNGNYGKVSIHMRYVAMYIPIWFAFCLPERVTLFNKRMRVALIVFCVLAIFPGIRMGYVKGQGAAASLSLAAFDVMSHFDGRIPGWILTAAMVLFAAIAWINLGNKKKNGKKDFFIGCFVFTLLFNLVCGGCASSVPIDGTIGADACELNAWISEEEAVLGFAPRYYDDIVIYWQEAHLNRPMQQITADQLFVSIKETQGVYSPFVPLDQAPNVNNGETPDTDTFVLGQTLAEHMELNEIVRTQTTANGHYTLAHGVSGERLIDTMMYGLSKNTLYAGETAKLAFFDGRTGTIPLTLTVQSTPGVKITVSGKNFSESYTTESNHRETISLEIPAGTVYISAEATMDILNYSTRDQA